MGVSKGKMEKKAGGGADKARFPSSRKKMLRSQDGRRYKGVSRAFQGIPGVEKCREA